MAAQITSEVDFIRALDNIEKQADNLDLAHVRYLFGAVIPQVKLDAAEHLRDCYYCLKESPEHYSVALSLTIYAISFAGCQQYMQQLLDYEKAETCYETEVSIPRFILRELLANIAKELSKDDAVDLVSHFAKLELHEHPDRFRLADQSQFASVLQMFVRAEQAELLKPRERELPKLREWLEQLKIKDLITRFLDDYFPTRTIALKVQNIQGPVQPAIEMAPSVVPELPPVDAWSMYRDLLTATYNEMPEIPPNQWPPITKAHYINLALITSGAMRRDDLFSRGTLRGTADDILKEKTPINYTDVFPDKLGAERALTLIEGRPGCGKSTLITKVSRDWAKRKVLKNVRLFILVHLRRFMGKSDLNIADLIGVYCKSNAVVQSLVESFEQTGGKDVCFAFDGLDEYMVQERGKLIYDMIHGYRMPRASILITSRPAAAHRLRRSVKQNIEIIGFLDNEIEQYIIDYYQENKVKAGSLMTFLQNHPNVSHMCYLPLHLAMVVFLYEHDENLPDTETEMYKTFVLQTLFRALERELGVAYTDDLELHDIDDLPDEKMRIFNRICHLAFEATRKQRQVFTGKQILDEKVLPVVPTKDDFNSLGLLTVDRQLAERALPTKTFSFLHLTLQEFLAAYHLVKQCSDYEQLKAIADHGGKIHMREVWKFYCGLASTSKIFLESFNAIAKQNVSNRLAILHMMHCAFESQKQEACCHLLDRIDGNVDVKDITLNPSDCSILGYVMTNKAEKVAKLDLSYCHLGPSGIEAFVQQLHLPFPNLHMLRLRARIDFRPVGSKGASSLVTLLKRLPNLGELRLYGNQLQAHTFQSLAPLIAGMGNIHTLILSRNSLDKTTGHLLSDILGNLPLLKTFYNSYNPIKDEGLGAMMPGLLKAQNLVILGLRCTSLTEGAGKHLQAMLKTLPKLEILELYQNRLRDKGVVDMLPGLYEAKALKQLSLVENEISDDGAVALAGYVSTTNTLQQFRLYYNDMHDKGKIALRRAALGRPAHLIELKLAV